MIQICIVLHPTTISKPRRSSNGKKLYAVSELISPRKKILYMVNVWKYSLATYIDT
jgi:hypothetical protein